jgi:hypothetical protein
MDAEKLTMVFDPQTIQHLGIQMYYTLPPVIAELVSNSYDADAKCVKVYLNDIGEKSIKVEDDGHGMTFDSINDKFLRIGRNRRNDVEKQKSESGNRYVIGKKGIGKLSFFGIAGHIEVETIRDGKRNVFSLNWDDLLSSENHYEPKVVVKDEVTEKKTGTSVCLTQIKRKTAFDPDNIAYNLAKTFTVFDESGFVTEIIHNGQEKEKITVTNELRYRDIEVEFEWNFPLDEPVAIEYINASKIFGKVISSKNPVPTKINGITLFSRGKLVNEPEFFSEKSSSFGYSYLTGWLNVDFIDDWKKDIISTNRKSLNWEDEDTMLLRNYLNEAVKLIYKKQREEKKKKQIELVSKFAKVNVPDWLSSLPKHEQALAKSLIDAILNSEGIPTQKQAEIVVFVKDSFQFESFKSYARELESVSDLDSGKLLILFKEWEFIEAKEMYKLATGRIQTIKTFETLIERNALEVKEVHPFFMKFPWILDPRINMFRHEAQYVTLLKENFPDAKLEEKNRRIDFLCTSVGGHRFVIELKRPKHEITKADIEQAKDYRSFIEQHCNTNPQSPNKVVAFIIGGSISDDRHTMDEVTGQQQLDKVYVKIFSQLLTDAQNYHHEFIERYEQLVCS